MIAVLAAFLALPAFWAVEKAAVAVCFSDSNADYDLPLDTIPEAAPFCQADGLCLEGGIYHAKMSFPARMGQFAQFAVTAF
jgi:hypothetical protein